MATKQIIKCSKCDTVMRAISSGMWMCKACGFTRDAKENEKLLWKYAFNKKGKQ